MSVKDNKAKKKEIADKKAENQQMMEEAFPTPVNGQMTDIAVEEEEAFPTSVNDQITD